MLLKNALQYGIIIATKGGDLMTEKMSGKRRRLNQRMQHFLVLQYLLEHTDENHYVGADDLVEYLKSKCEIYSENRSIYKDIREINIAYLMIEEDVTHQEAVEMLDEDPDRATVKY